MAQGVRKGTSRPNSVREGDTRGSENLPTTGSAKVRSIASERLGGDDNDVAQKDFF